MSDVSNKHNENWSEIRVPQTPYSKRYAGMIGIAFIIIGYHYLSASNTTLMPVMAKEIGGMDLYPLAISLFSVLCTVFIPLFARLAKTQDKGRMFMIGCCIFVAGCILNSFAQNMYMTIAARIIMGIGGGAQSCLFFLVITDLWDNKYRPKFQGWFGTFVAVGLIGGSFLTGIIIDTIGWRWVFWVVFIPLYVIGCALFMVMLPKYPPEITKEESGKLDVMGLILIFIAFTTLSVSLTFQGSRLPWSDWKIYVLLAVCVISFALLVRVENKAGKSAIMPMKIFKTRAVWCFLGAVIGVAGCYGILSFGGRALMQNMGSSATMVGLLFAVIYIPMVFLSAPMGALLGRKPQILRPFMASAGFCYIFAAIAFLVLLKPQPYVLSSGQWTFMFVMMIIYGFGSISATFGWVAATQFILPRELWTDGVALVRIGFMLGSVFGNAIFGGIINASPNFYTGYHTTLYAILGFFVFIIICALMLKTPKDTNTSLSQKAAS